MKSRNPLTRANAVEQLGACADRAVVPLIIPALADPDQSVRHAAARALGQLGDQRALEPLLSALKGEQVGSVWREVRDAVAALVPGWPRSEAARRAVSPLIASLRCDDKSIRSRAAFDLGDLGDAGVVPVLVEVLSGDPDGEVRQAAAGALSRFGTAATGPLLATLPGDRPPSVTDLIVKTLTTIDREWGRSDAARECGPRLIEALTGSKEEQRYTAACALRHVPYPAALEPLIVAVQDPCERVREQAASALGNQGDGKAIPHLIPLLGTGGALQRMTVAFALKSLGWQPGTDAERAAFSIGNGDWGSVPRSAGAVGPLLAIFAERFSEDWIENAASALGRIADPAALTDLAAAAAWDGDPWPSKKRRAAAATALGYLGEAAVEPLVALVRCTYNERWGKWEDRSAAVTALGRIVSALAYRQDPRAVVSLIVIFMGLMYQHDSLDDPVYRTFKKAGEAALSLCRRIIPESEVVGRHKTLWDIGSQGQLFAWLAWLGYEALRTEIPARETVVLLRDRLGPVGCDVTRYFLVQDLPVDLATTLIDLVDLDEVRRSATEDREYRAYVWMFELCVVEPLTQIGNHRAVAYTVRELIIDASSRKLNVDSLLEELVGRHADRIETATLRTLANLADYKHGHSVMATYRDVDGWKHDVETGETVLTPISLANVRRLAAAELERRGERP